MKVSSSEINYLKKKRYRTSKKLTKFEKLPHCKIIWDCKILFMPVIVIKFKPRKQQVSFFPTLTQNLNFHKKHLLWPTMYLCIPQNDKSLTSWSFKCFIKGTKIELWGITEIAFRNLIFLEKFLKNLICTSTRFEQQKKQKYSVRSSFRNS